MDRQTVKVYMISFICYFTDFGNLNLNTKPFTTFHILTHVFNLTEAVLIVQHSPEFITKNPLVPEASYP